MTRSYWSVKAPACKNLPELLLNEWIGVLKESSDVLEQVSPSLTRNWEYCLPWWGCVSVIFSSGLVD